MKSSKTMLAPPEIPSDLLIEILNRLSIKSLARFKCVSKLWSSLICSKGYLFASPPRLFISLSKNHESCGLMGDVCHNRVKSVLLSLSVDSSNKSSTVFNLDTKKQGIEGRNMVVLRGLILYNDTQACIYNPTTGQRVTLPAIKFKTLAEEEYKYHTYFFGYDPVLDQYKVLCTAMLWSVNLKRSYTRHWVFVLEARSSWKKIEFDQPLFTKNQGVCINGIIYYLASSYEGFVICFNVRSEEFNMIEIPHAVNGYVQSYYVGLIEYGGKSTLFDHRHVWDSDSLGLVNLWILEDAGTWSKISLFLQPSQMHLLPHDLSFEVNGTTQNGEVVLIPIELSHFYILYYDLHKNDLKRIDLRGISDDEHEWNLDMSHVWNFNLALMDSGDSIMPLKI